MSEELKPCPSCNEAVSIEREMREEYNKDKKKWDVTSVEYSIWCNSCIEVWDLDLDEDDQPWSEHTAIDEWNKQHEEITNE